MLPADCGACGMERTARAMSAPLAPGGGEPAADPGRGERVEEGITSLTGIDRRDLPGRVEQDGSRLRGLHQRIVNGALEPLGRDPLVRIIELPSHAVQKGLGAQWQRPRCSRLARRPGRAADVPRHPG